MHQCLSVASSPAELLKAQTPRPHQRVGVVYQQRPAAQQAMKSLWAVVPVLVRLIVRIVNATAIMASTASTRSARFRTPTKLRSTWQVHPQKR